MLLFLLRTCVYCVMVATPMFWGNVGHKLFSMERVNLQIKDLFMVGSVHTVIGLNLFAIFLSV